MIVLKHFRIQVSRNQNSTRGVLMTPTNWLGEVLEDGPRKEKVRGMTRIDAKDYVVRPIQYGRFYEQYAEEHGHKFAIALVDTVDGPDRAGRHGNVRVHKGNKVENTDGCPLICNRVDFDPKTGLFFGVAGSSTPAYLRLYEYLEQYYDAEKKAFSTPIFWDIVEQEI